jgi:hypothetical protein
MEAVPRPTALLAEGGPRVYNHRVVAISDALVD